ncbi:hypothetical protein GCK72_020891 [Caenorhabditis remanei]|uniref:Uncharacterized protein n=1 Tax=Caenorhabditis remanei TaxID=31234 RepID=A0A6A5GIA7_CAERE|nr:hypothetical protein GCK72_020891 [Caenorhabditis remanei]KAF1754331.1 hypothetical protein GCK72_020891 [Caenorhabditis remanei]
MPLAHNHSLFIKTNEKWWFEWHSAPQTWNCDFYKYISDFHLIPIGTSLEDRQIAMKKLQKVLRFAKVEDEYIEKIMRDTLESDTKHATHNSDLSQQVLEQVQTDPYVRHYLHRIYYFDYIAFGMKLPKFFNGQDFPKEFIPRS